MCEYQTEVGGLRQCTTTGSKRFAGRQWQVDNCSTQVRYSSIYHGESMLWIRWCSRVFTHTIQWESYRYAVKTIPWPPDRFNSGHFPSFTRILMRKNFLAVCWLHWVYRERVSVFYIEPDVHVILWRVNIWEMRVWWQKRFGLYSQSAR